MSDADLLVIGGGINGTGIARDAAGRGLSVMLVEQGDLGSATSSASSKLVHGGLRYLEHGELRLVAEALREREVLLRAAPHIVRPMRFVLPSSGERPGWLIRLGLLTYDWLARLQTLPASEKVSLDRPPYGSGLKSQYSRGYAYSDCWVDDARLVVLNAKAAHDLGARILPRTRFMGAERRSDVWVARVRGADGVETEVAARVLVNAAGPWADRVAVLAGKRGGSPRLRLVQGSHIVVPKLYEGEHAFILQNDDRRVIFVYAYEGHTLVGTTDVETGDDPASCHVTPEEIEYLCRAANRYFEREVQPADVIWSYSGVRALVDDGSARASRVSRDYLLELDMSGPPLLSVFGGKITTYRKLAERVMEKLSPLFPALGPAWTAAAPLPGGDLPPGGVAAYVAQLRLRYSELPGGVLSAVARRHGTSTPSVLGVGASVHDLGEHFGANLYAREVDYLRQHEWADNADDVLWRRTKAGLHLAPEQRARVAAYLQESSMKGNVNGRITDPRL